MYDNRNTMQYVSDPAPPSPEPYTPKVQLKQATITYPVVEGIKSKSLQSKINRKIREEAEKLLPNATNFPDVIYADSRYTQTVLKNDVMSLYFENNFYWRNAAHPMTYTTSINLDLQKGKVYRLRDLFRPNSPWKERLTQIIQQQIISRQIPLINEFRGVTGDDQFYLTEDSLVIYYQLYEFTPYYYGILMLPIVYSEIREIIDPKGPIGGW